MNGRLAVFLLAAALAAPALAEEVLLWRIWPAGNVSVETAADLEKRLTEAARARHPGRSVPAGRVQEFFLTAGSERFLHCGRSLECLADLGNSLEAARVATGFLERAADEYFTELMVVDSQSRRAVLHTRLRHGRALDSRALENLLQAIFSPERFTGRLRLECPLAGAQVWLDEEPLAFCPLEKALEVAAGVHRLTVRGSGYLEFSREVDIAPGANQLVVAVLVPLPRPEEAKPFYRRWPFWLLAGGGTALLIAGGVLWADVERLRENARLARQAGLVQAEYWQERADRRAVESYSCFALGAGALAGAVVITTLDLFSRREAARPPAFALWPRLSHRGWALLFEW
jgi:hypothetical protein